MEMQDNPIMPQEVSLEDTPIAQPKDSSGKSKDTDSYEAGQAAFLDNYVTGNPVLENYNYYSGVINKSEDLRRLSEQKASMDSTALEEALVEDPYGESGSIQQTSQAVQASMEQVFNKKDDPDHQFMETLVGPENVNLEEVDRQAAYSRMYKIVSDAEEELGVGDYVGDFFISAIPFWESKRGGSLTGKYFNQEGMIQQAIARFKNKPIAEQEAMFPYLKEHLENTVGDVHTVNILSNFLKPLGSENRQGFSNAEKVFDAIDVAGMGPLVKAAFKGLKTGFNTVKSAKALGNEEGAIEINTAALADPTTAKAAGLSEGTATSNALPYDVSREDLSSTPGLSAKTLKGLDEYFGRVDKTADDIIAGNSFLKEGLVSTRQRAELEAEAIAKLQSEKADNIVISAQDEVSTTFSYQTLDESGELTEQTRTMQLSLNDAGQYEQSEIGLIAKYLGSPSAHARGTLAEDVQTAQRVDYLNDRLNKQLLLQVKDALKPIGMLPTKKNKASHARVDNALIEGDEWKNADGTRGRVFKPDELISRFGLEENEISSYYRLNRLYNNLHRIRNHEVRQERVVKGYKGINFTRNEEMMDGKPFETANDGRLSLTNSNTNYVYDAELDDLVAVRGDSSKVLDDAYNNDKKLVRLSSAYDIGGGRTKVNYALVSNDSITDLPQQVLPRKKGYVARSYKDATYFVKETFEEVVDGDKTIPGSKTLRFFDNKKDADIYVEQLVQKEVSKVSKELEAKRAAYDKKVASYEKSMERYNAGKRKTKPSVPKPPNLDKKFANIEAAARAKYKARADREEATLASAMGDVSNGTGGLYTGARAQDDILFGLNGDKPQRLNSFESLTRNINNLSKFTSINQWRMGMEQRWINTVNRIYEEKGMANRVTDFARLSPDAENAKEIDFLNQAYDRIKTWQGVPTQSEQAWTGMMNRLYELAGNKGYKKTAKMLGYLGSKDPVSVARATSFHSLLGWFNFSQLIVQAQGAVIAASLGAGKYLTKSVGQSTALHMMDVGKSGIRGAAKQIGRASGMTEKEVLKFHELWRKAGYFDSVKQTADHAAVSKGYGLNMELFKRVSDSGLVFYRAGELVNRRMSFSVAVNRWLEKGAERTIESIDDAALKSIMDDANAMMLGMTKANRAAWQKGVLGIPSQFLQVTTKFVETAGGFNKAFSKEDRQRMIAAQFALYGTAGVPGVGLGTKIAMESMGITQQEVDNNPGLAKAWNDGIIGAATFWMLGADIEVASRGSLLRGVSDFMDTWFVRESTMTEKFLGAFGSTQTRFWDSFMHQMKPFTLGNMSTIDMTDVASLVAMPFLDTISTSRNIVKAEYMQRLDAIYSGAGRLHDSHDFNMTEEWAMRLGFQPTRDSETWDIIEQSKAAESLKQTVIEYTLKEMNSFALKYPNGDFTDAEFAKHNARLSSALGVLDPDEAMEVNETIFREISGDSRRAKAVARAYRNTKTSITGEASAWHSALLGSQVLRVGEPLEEQE